MKKTLSYILVAAACIGTGACKEDTLKVYDGDNYVHFNPNSSDKVELSYNFALGESTREEEYSIAVPIRLWGYLPEKDFRCKVSVVKDGTTALPSDYEEPVGTIFRKGYPMDTLYVTVCRRPELLSTDYTLAIHLDSADGHVAAPAQYLTANIKVTDHIVVKPSWWNTTNAVGPYSDMKFRMFNYYLGKYLNNLDGYTTITFKSEAVAFKNWWKEKFENGEFKYFAEDGTTPLYETIPD